MKAPGTVRLTAVRATSWPSTLRITSATKRRFSVTRSHFDFMLAGGQFFLSPGLVAFDDHHVVFVNEVPLSMNRVRPPERRLKRRCPRGVRADLGVDADVVTLAAQARGAVNSGIRVVVASKTQLV